MNWPHFIIFHFHFFGFPVFRQPPPHSFRLLVVCIPPQLLELLMKVLWEFVAFQDGVQILEVSLKFGFYANYAPIASGKICKLCSYCIVAYQCPCPQHWFRRCHIYLDGHRQREEEASELVDLTMENGWKMSMYYSPKNRHCSSPPAARKSSESVTIYLYYLCFYFFIFCNFKFTWSVLTPNTMGKEIAGKRLFAGGALGCWDCEEETSTAGGGECFSELFEFSDGLVDDVLSIFFGIWGCCLNFTTFMHFLILDWIRKLTWISAAVVGLWPSTFSGNNFS